ncbi:methylated-DNA--[protein]-cysteine S-methyltransferase [Aquimonas voraii]|uniref:Methylated-DNA--protein-cysteine methyltransferase n=1 Tax=Aquimonas voraii TaxID=265719 RepID=A0A1G6VJK9_9GAMM|nr:methylated-DNA-[protein]-cysteine S-methyltransferase [Aquimonas voraii]
MPIHYLSLASPIGRLTVAASATALHAIEFEHNRHAQPRAHWVSGETPLLRHAADQLHEYFAGRRRRFELPLAPQGTEFQRAAWQALAAIPFGETRSYAQQAAALGKPAATRAVGAANGRNPLPIVLPCHRVIGANGALTGFGGGIEIKRWLLAHEAGTGFALG